MTLARNLLESSGRWMRKSLAEYGDGERSDLAFAVHHAGIAIEHLLKAYLCEQNPAFIADNGRNVFDSMLILTTAKPDDAARLERVKTIGAPEAFKRCKALLGGALDVSQGGFEGAAEGRNSVSHMGVVSQARAQSIVSTFCKVADSLISAMGVSAPEYWWHYDALHRDLVAQRSERLSLVVNAKLAAAKERYATLDNDMDRILALEDITDFTQSDDNTWQVDCPACGRNGRYCGKSAVVLEPVSAAGQRGFQISPEEVAVAISFEPSTFRCWVCGLDLATEELAFAGLSTDGIITGEDPERYFANLSAPTLFDNDWNWDDENESGPSW